MEAIFTDGDLPLYEIEEQIGLLIKENMHLNYCKVASVYMNDMEPREWIVFHFFAHRLINEDDDMIGNHEWEDLVGGKRYARALAKNIKSNSSILSKDGIIEPTVNEGMKDCVFYHLSDKTKAALFPDLDFVDTQAAHGKGLTPCTSFAKKDMFYSPRVKSQIDRLASLLQPEYFTQVVQRLGENGMRKGFACLFYGSPGAGKTETVNQLARDFDLSGGHIENIARKRTVELILSGEEPSEDMLREYCSSEMNQL